MKTRNKNEVEKLQEKEVSRADAGLEEGARTCHTIRGGH